MNVKDLIDQLKMVKDKETEVIFKTGSNILEVVAAMEVVYDAESSKIHPPYLGEKPNAVVLKLTDVPTVANDVASE